MKRTDYIMMLVAGAAMIVSSCAREDMLFIGFDGLETHTVFNLTVTGNTKNRWDGCSKSTDDSKTSYDAENKCAYFDSDMPFGLVQQRAGRESAGL